MLDFISDILTNIIANLLFWITGGFVVGVFLSKRRKKLHRFFGIRDKEPLFVYLSGIPIEKGGAKDRFGTPSVYQGITVPIQDFQVVPKIMSLFLSTPLTRIPETLSGLVDRFWLVKQPIIEFSVYKPENNNNFCNSLISIGGPRFNAVTDYYLKSYSSYFSFQAGKTGWEVRIARGSRTGEFITPPEGWDIGVLLRIKDTEYKTNIFVAAGISVNGTRAAIEYLIENWSNLYNQYGDSEFGISLRCPCADLDASGYKKVEIVCKLPN